MKSRLLPSLFGGEGWTRHFMKRIQGFILFLIIFIALKPVAACSYYEYPSVCDAYSSAEAVFVGTIQRIAEVKDLETFRMTNTQTGKEETNSVNGLKYYIKVEKTYKGASQTEITLAVASDSCRVYQMVGDKLLLYVRFDKKLQMWKLSRGSSGALELAGDDLLFLDGLPETLNRTRISGRLYSVDTKADFPFTWLSGVKLKFQSKNRAFETTTDQNGLYEIYDLPLGAYTIIPQIQEDLIPGHPTYRALGRVVRKLPTPEDVHFGWVDLKDTRCIGVNFSFKPKKNEQERK